MPPDPFTWYKDNKLSIQRNRLRYYRESKCKAGVASSVQWWRDDGRCGVNNKLANGRPAECNPLHPKGHTCCSAKGWCGGTANHCKVKSCSFTSIIDTSHSSRDCEQQQLILITFPSVPWLRGLHSSVEKRPAMWWRICFTKRSSCAVRPLPPTRYQTSDTMWQGFAIFNVEGLAMELK